eukprot:TRINITY_DN72159_c0_g1_i1.p1 TRINITY_DN72159_c0_g1~~TRINITY_DN72159_c0_g1_i1.p1  ORF type:complete len:260 (-),score=47.15 TRINITY_DN72159_c0_g1_i1:288-1046(-)
MGGVFTSGAVVESVFRLQDGRSVVVKHPKSGGGLGFMPWPGAWALAKYIDDHAAELQLQDKRAVELGSGACALAGRVATLHCKEVMLTDTSEVTPHLCELARASPAPRPDVRELNWVGIWTTDAMYQPGDFDLVLMSDVVYFDFLFKPLMNTLLALCDLDTVVLWGNCDAFPDYRNPDIARFLTMISPFFDISVAMECSQDAVGAPQAVLTNGHRVTVYELRLKNLDTARAEVERALQGDIALPRCLKRVIA